VHLEPCFRKQRCMPALTTGAVEHAGARRQAQYVEQPRYLTTIPFRCEERLILEQVLVVEVRRPPVRGGRCRSVPGGAASEAGTGISGLATRSRTHGAWCLSQDAQKNTGSR